MSTPHKLLKRAFGRDKALLDSLPLHKFEYKAHKHCWSAEYEDIALHYGRMLDDQNVSREVWAHLSRSGRAGEIHYIGFHPADGSPVQFKAKDVAENAQIREEFHLVSGRVQELSALLRACIMLHGGKVAGESLKFPETFLKSLRRASARYKGGLHGQADASPTSSGRPSAAGYVSSPAVPLVLESSMRSKYSVTQKEQRGPHPPRFDALHPYSSPLPPGRAGRMSQAQSQRNVTAYGHSYTNIGQNPDYGRGAAHGDNWHPHAAGNDLDDINANFSSTPRAPRAMMRIWSKEQLNDENARRFSDGDSDVKIEPVQVATSSLELQAQTETQFTQPMMETQTFKAHCPKESPVSSSKPLIAMSVTPSAFDELIALDDQIRTVREEMGRCKQSILEANTTWTQRRGSKCKEIDQDLCQKYKDEFALPKDQYEKLKVELHVRHKAEHAELKAQYNKMKEDQQLDISVLQELENKKGLELEALEHRLAEQRQMLTKDPDKLLDAVLAQGTTNGKRKRETSSDTGRDSRDQDVTMSG